MANERASSNVTEAANQVMNIDNATQTYAKGTGGGGISPLVAHAHAVDTRRSFFSPPPPRPSERLGTRLSSLRSLLRSAVVIMCSNYFKVANLKR